MTNEENRIVVGNIQFNNKGEITNKESLKELFEHLEEQNQNPVDYRFDIEKLVVKLVDKELSDNLKNPGYYITGEVSIKKQIINKTNYVSEIEIAKYKFKSNPGVDGLTKIFCEDEFCRYNELSIFIKIYCAGIKHQDFYWSRDVREM